MHEHGEHGIIGVLGDAVMITGFVLVMMLVVEYLNVLSRGRLHIKLAKRKWQQYLLAAALGAVPGCLGSFAVVGLYSHRVVSLGAVVCAMIVTTGDEAFLMLTKIPGTAVALAAGLTLVGVGAGVVTDLVVRGRRFSKVQHDLGFAVHDEHVECFARGRVLEQWRQCSPARGVLAVGLALFAAAAALGGFEAHAAWVRVTLVGASLAAFFIVATVPDHFLDEHLWAHVARQHVPRVFGWTVGALVLLAFLTERLHMDHVAEGGGRWFVLVVACLVGLIPQSGPHYIFIMLYGGGALPLAVLVANSVVQEGHGLLPMLAHSRRAFFAIKALKLVLGLGIGAILMLF